MAERFLSIPKMLSIANCFNTSLNSSESSLISGFKAINFSIIFRSVSTKNIPEPQAGSSTRQL